MSDLSISCIECQKTFVFSEKELEYFKELHRQGKLEVVEPPKRCPPCRDLRRRAAKAYVRSPEAAPPASSPAPGPAPKNGPFTAPIQIPVGLRVVGPPPPAPPPPTARQSLEEHLVAEEVRIVLVAQDFEKLVCREELEFRKGRVKVVVKLADIGLVAMKEAMERAVIAWWKS